MKKILYLHGLNSTLHQDRREVLEKLNVQIFAPQLDYEKNPNVLDELISEFNVEAVIGSSAGGLAAYYFSGLKRIPALLFNPALPFRHYIQQIPDLPSRDKFLQVVLGARDTDVPAHKTFEFLTEEFDKNVPLEIHWINQMEHRLPIYIFENEVNYFWNMITKNP